MVYYGNLDDFPRRTEHPRDAVVLRARLRIARRMVVHEYYRHRTVLDGMGKSLARVYRRLVHESQREFVDLDDTSTKCSWRSNLR